MKLNLVCLQNVDIQTQLELEEALLRADTENWCLINEGSSPAIVMGISGKPELLINKELLKQNPIPVIRRFSGGGTVVVDHHTHFITFICNSSHVNISPYPESILRWTEEVYKPLFSGHEFSLKENDYIIDNRKFGGNAQYIRKDRWLHHSSFLWNFDEKLMNYLLLPPKIPLYRVKRNHTDFLCRLKDYYPCRKALQANFIEILGNKFDIREVSYDSVLAVKKQTYRKSTHLIDCL